MITNSIKHAFQEGRSGTISLKLKKTKTSAILIVEDDGYGIPEGFDYRKNTFMGLKLINALPEQIDGSFKIENGNSTRDIFKLPKEKNNYN